MENKIRGFSVRNSTHLLDLLQISIPMSIMSRLHVHVHVVFHSLPFCLQFEMDCSESTCDTVTYETFPVQVATSFMKITLDEKCVEGGVGGFREVRALSMVYDGKKNKYIIHNPGSERFKMYICTASPKAKHHLFL